MKVHVLARKGIIDMTQCFGCPLMSAKKKTNNWQVQMGTPKHMSDTTIFPMYTGVWRNGYTCDSLSKVWELEFLCSQNRELRIC